MDLRARVSGTIALMVMGLTLQGCSDAEQGQQVQEKPRVVQLSAVRQATEDSKFTFPAKVVPKTTVDLAFRVAGRMQYLNLPEGQLVKKGQVLAKLDNSPFDLAIASAKVQVKQTKLELDRVKAIATKGIGSDQSVDNAQVAYEMALINLEGAEDNLRYSVLKAPFDALVSKRLIENKGFIGVGNSIAHLQDLSKIHFEFDVPERIVSNYRKEQVSKATAYIDGAIDQDFPIEYVEHSTEPHPVSQTYRVVYAMDNQAGLDITPGVRATVTIEGDAASMPQVLGIPVNALMTANDDSLSVWLYDEQTQRISKQTVVVGPMLQGWVAVLSGLEKGQQVVSAGVTQLREGQLVRPYVAE